MVMVELGELKKELPKFEMEKLRVKTSCEGCPILKVFDYTQNGDLKREYSCEDIGFEMTLLLDSLEDVTAISRPEKCLEKYGKE